MAESYYFKKIQREKFRKDLNNHQMISYQKLCSQNIKNQSICFYTKSYQK